MEGPPRCPAAAMWKPTQARPAFLPGRALVPVARTRPTSSTSSRRLELMEPARRGPNGRVLMRWEWDNRWPVLQCTRCLRPHCPLHRAQWRDRKGAAKSVPRRVNYGGCPTDGAAALGLTGFDCQVWGCGAQPRIGGRHTGRVCPGDLALGHRPGEPKSPKSRYIWFLVIENGRAPLPYRVLNPSPKAVQMQINNFSVPNKQQTRVLFSHSHSLALSENKKSGLRTKCWLCRKRGRVLGSSFHRT